MKYFTEEASVEAVNARMGEEVNPRLAEIMAALVKHLHGFVKEVSLTQAEWETAITFLTETGQMCSNERQEFVLLSDTLGVSMLIDAINNRRPERATENTVFGPFHVDGGLTVIPVTRILFLALESRVRAGDAARRTHLSQRPCGILLQTKRVAENRPIAGGIEIRIFHHHDGLALAGISCVEQRLQVVNRGNVAGHQRVEGTVCGGKGIARLWPRHELPFRAKIMQRHQSRDRRRERRRRGIVAVPAG